MCTSWSGSEVCCSAAARRAGTILGRNRWRVSLATEDSTARALVLMGGVTSWGGARPGGYSRSSLAIHHIHHPHHPQHITPTTHHTFGTRYGRRALLLTFIVCLSASKASSCWSSSS